jgi:PEGA domain
VRSRFHFGLGARANRVRVVAIMITTARLTGGSRALRTLLMMGTLALLASFSTAAQAKKAHKLKMDPTVAAEPEPTGPVPPEADAAGHVNYGNPQAEGIGRVTVKASNGDKIQVYLEGRYFGDTPVTIYSVPKGDYIVEGTIISSGKQLSRPVSVSENEEATVELGGGKIETPPDATAPSGGLLSGEISPQRKRIAEICAVAGVVTLIAGVTFAILEHGAESDYEMAPAGNQQNLDSISSRGNRDALLANLSFVVMGAAVVGTVVAGYPMFTHHAAEKPPEAPPTAFLVAPVVGHGTAGGALSFRF